MVPSPEHREDPAECDVHAGRAQHRVPRKRGRGQDVARGQTSVQEEGVPVSEEEPGHGLVV